MNNQLPLADLPKLIAQDFNAIEAQYKQKIEFYLSHRILSRTLIAGSVGKEFEMDISIKAKLGIKGAAKVLEKGVPAAVHLIAPYLLAIEIGAGVIALATGTLTVGGVVVIAVAVAATGGAMYAKKRTKNKIRAKAKIYQNFFPKEKSIIELFSQLLTLAVTEELNAIQSQPAEVESMFSSVKNTLHNAWKFVCGTNVEVKEDKEQQQIKILSKAEFQKIWEIFKIFARQPEKYAEFANTSKAQAMLALFEKVCGFADVRDGTTVINDADINVFWLNIFACYLEEKGEKVYESVVSSLTAKFSAVGGQQRVSSIEETSILKEQISVLQDQVNILQKEALEVSDNVSSLLSFFGQNIRVPDQSMTGEDLQFIARCV